MAAGSARNDESTSTRILDTAEALLQVRGYNGFSYADISTELGITKAALHYHFPGKADLGLALITRYADRFGESLAAIDRAEAPPALVEATPRQVAEAVRIGPYVMPEFSEHSISNRQLDSIIRYVEFTDHASRPGGWGLGFLGPVPEGLATWFLAIPLLIGLCLVLGRRFRS